MEDNLKIKEENPNKQTGSLTDYAFKFPLENSFSKVEIPFAFQSNLNENSKAGSFHSYIKIQETPTLYLDISNEKKVDKLFLASTIDTLKVENTQHQLSINNLEKQLTNTKTENDNLKEEILRLNEDLITRSQCAQTLGNKIKQNEEKYERFLMDINSKLNEKLNIKNILKEKADALDKFALEYQMKNGVEIPKEILAQEAKNQFDSFLKEYSNSKDYLQAKFSNDYHGNLYIQKSLQLDLLDYQAYVKEQLKLIKPKIAELIKLIQNSVNDSIGKDYEVKLYGSHATNLCLPWSDLDVVIIKNDGTPITNSHTLLAELYKHFKDKQIFNTMNFISTTTIPLIKIQTESEFNNISVDISLQCSNHFGIKCVALVMNFIKEYEVLVPMVLALKNILKHAGLNNPYKVSYYYYLFL